MLLSYADPTDQRVIQVNRRIDAITGRIEAERQNLGVAGVEGALPEIIGAYEEQLVDLEFASTAYTQALATPRMSNRPGPSARSIPGAACSPD